MSGTMSYKGTYAVVICAFLLGGMCPAIQAQTASSLPDGWQQLSAGEFVAALPGVYEPDEDIYGGDVEESAVRRHAAGLLASLDFETTQEDYNTLYWLYALAYPELEEAKLDQVQAALETRVDTWAGRPYAEVRAKACLMWRAGLSSAYHLQPLQSWLAAGGDEADIWAEDLSEARDALGEFVELNQDFTLQWAGSVTAPADGAYTFSISPINVSGHAYSLHDRYDLLQTMTVTVGGQQVISATPENWDAEGTPVQLSAGQATPLSVEMTVDSDRLPTWAVHALLYWSGPGVPREIVPASRLTPPSGEGQGLERTLSWEADGEPLTLTQTVPNIDDVWADGVMIFQDLEVKQRVQQRMWEELMDPAYLASVTGGVERHQFLNEAEATVDTLTAAQRQQFLSVVLQQPAMLDRLKLKEMVDVYRAFRMGAPAQALDAFGVWAKRHADASNRMPHEYENSMRHFREFLGFDFYNRKAYRLLAICVGLQLPEHAERLQSEYLVQDDGSCSLPVAYTLAYAYLGQERFDDWVAFLDSQLEGDNLSGEQRVNWLLARAYAAEMRLFPADLYADGKVRPTDGRRWIEEAEANAETAATRVRLARELAGRLTAIGKFDEARSMLVDVTDGAPPELQSDIAVCQDCITRFEAWNAESQIRHAEAAQENYLATLRARREQAATSGDTAAASRYDSLIQAAEPAEEE